MQLPVIVYSIVFTVICAILHKRKGYKAINGALWGFFFGILGLIVVLLERNKQEIEQGGKKQISVGVWILIFVAIGCIPVIFLLM